MLRPSSARYRQQLAYKLQGMQNEIILTNTLKCVFLLWCSSSLIICNAMSSSVPNQLLATDVAFLQEICFIYGFQYMCILVDAYSSLVHAAFGVKSNSINESTLAQNPQHNIMCQKHENDMQCILAI